MIYGTPLLDEESDGHVLGRIQGLWRELQHLLVQEPYSWHGILRRQAAARSLRASNAIEGIHFSTDDAAAAVGHDEPFDSPGEGDDWKAAIGYADAMTYVLGLSREEPFRYDAGLLKALHFMITRHDLQALPGRFRLGPVYVLSASGEAIYEGAPAPDVPGLVDELVEDLNTPSTASPLVRAAMAHMNFVMIHPFRDGNGRMSRILQSLVLARAGLLDPTFCSVEEYLGRNTGTYYEKLAAVGGPKWAPTTGNALIWTRFILVAHYRQAMTHLRRHHELGNVWSDIETLVTALQINDRCVPSLVNASLGMRIRNHHYRVDAEVSSLVASRDLRGLVEAGLLIAKGERRGRHYVASDRILEIRARHRKRTPIPNPFEPPEETDTFR